MLTIASPSSFFSPLAMVQVSWMSAYLNQQSTAGVGHSGVDMPRFVILEHDWPTRHWDFLLEAGDVLRAWRLLDEPAPGKAVLAEPNFDHRLLYLDFEGALSGNRG